MIIRITRSGGFAGRVSAGEVDTTADPTADRLRTFLHATQGRGRGPLRLPPGADRMLYTFEFDGTRVMLSEQDLPADVAAIVQRALRR